MKLFKNTKEIIYLLITFAVLIKLLLTDFTGFKLPENLTDIISLALALFSVGLSALFYFKANEASNQFYNNTYQFTKDISEKIGRIEERFGKDLDNIDKNYSRMLDRIDRLPITETIQKEIEQKTDSEKQIVEEKERIINDLIEKSSISQEEKEIITRQLHKKERELEAVKNQLYDLNNQLENTINKNKYLIPTHTINILSTIVEGIIDNNGIPGDFRELMELVEKRISGLNDNNKIILMNERIIDSNNKLKTRGKKIISSLISEAS
ncbi:hypothetical protein EC604_27290 [Paenibacillus amylolyticus]|uniref:Uncharacterized protein n=1 Tax=Paenibacillus amylolyticus TaxID=1451 RepID=A0A5M9X190_PAEAM|nr:hypothetical protein [Paenibacillus amylolyticus]KAA8787542.1 hypothetical protein EC604_27290 [Paenibacillus amylolyticus]